MKLYHGTNQDITTIDPSLGMRHKDLGQGFYLTPEYDNKVTDKPMRPD